MKKQIGAKIKEGRERIGINQGTLGMIALGYPKSEQNAAQMKISKIESGKQDVTIPELIKIAEILKLELRDILGFDLPADPPPPEPDTGPPQTIPWELKTIIDGLQTQIGGLVRNMERYRADLDDTNNHVAEIKASMLKAALAGDVKKLKVSGGNS